MQNLLKKGRANLSRSKSELGDHNRKILQQLSRQRTEIGEQNKRLLASFRIKEIQSLHDHNKCGFRCIILIFEMEPNGVLQNRFV